jgi:hypothetical protein
MARGMRQKPIAQGSTALNLHSGRLHCRIVALGPIFIKPFESGRDHTTVLNIGLGGGENHSVFRKFFSLDGRNPMIAGSSLKGELRSVCEALSNACFSNYGVSYPLPSGLYSCKNIDQLCITCRMFGMAPQDDGSQELFRGKVLISDAIFQGEIEDIYDHYVTLPELSSPKPRHRQFYMANGKLVGRKFYYHHDRLQVQGKQYEDWQTLQQTLNAPIFKRNDNNARNCTVHPLRRGSLFDFTVDYADLTDEELQLLVMGLELKSHIVTSEQDNSFFIPNPGDDFVISEGVYHKIGYGKPVGLGSCAILITGWEEIDLKDRYSGRLTPGLTLRSDYRDDVNSLKAAYERKHQQKTYYQDLMQILRYPNGITDIRYPKYGQFDGVELPVPGRE